MRAADEGPEVGSLSWCVGELIKLLALGAVAWLTMAALAAI